MNDCKECEAYDREHDESCPLHPDHDPTPWCWSCGARTPEACNCGPIADND